MNIRCERTEGPEILLPGRDVSAVKRYWDWLSVPSRLGIFVVLFFLLPLLYLFFLLLINFKEDGRTVLRSFGYVVDDRSQASGWPVVYETNLDLSSLELAAARLRAAGIPAFVESNNLFNSGIYWSFGLLVFAKLRVHEEKQNEALELLDDQWGSSSGQVRL